MEINQLRAKLHEYIDGADESTIKKLLTFFQRENKTVSALEEPRVAYTSENKLYGETFSKEDFELFDKRSAALLSGEDKGASWEEVRARIIEKKTR